MGDSRKAYEMALKDCEMGTHTWFARDTECHTCGKERSYFPCLDCDGRGWRWENLYDDNDNGTCRDCDGTGRIFTE